MKKSSITAILFFCFSLTCFAQDVKWAYSIGSGSHERGQQVVSDGGAYVYVTGYYWENLFICNDSLPTTITGQTGNAASSLFLAKYDSTGNCVWAIPGLNIWAPVGQETQVHEMLYHNGNVYLCGSFSHKLVWGNDTLFCEGQIGGRVSPFIIKVDDAGTVIWAQTFQGPTRSDAWDMTIMNDSIYLVGDFTDSIIFGNTILHETVPNYLWDNGYLAKLDLDGNVIWAEKTGNSRYYSATNITNDGYHLYVSGEFMDSIEFDGTVIYDSLSLGKQGDFITKYTGDGSILWSKGGIGFTSGITYDLELNFDGVQKIYMATWMSDTTSLGIDTFNVAQGNALYVVAKLDTSCNFIWTDATPYATGPGQLTACNVLPDDQGYYMAANYSQPMTIQDSSLTSAGSTDIFLARYDTAANLLWLKHFGGTSGEYVGDLHFKSGILYMAGSTMSNYSIDNESLVANGGLDVLFARFNDTAYQEPQSVNSFKSIDIAIYPNPANTHVILKTNHELYSTFTMTNAIGQNVMKDAITGNEQKIDIQKLPPGMYYITITGKGIKHVGKLVKIQ